MPHVPEINASVYLFFFFNDTPTTEIYTLSHTTLFRSGDDERAICLHRWPAATGQLSRYAPGAARLEGLLALRRRDLYLRLFGDGHGGRGREGAGGNPAASQSLSRGGLGRGRRAIVSQLRRFAQRRAPGVDHVEHGSNRRQEICRSSHRL